MNYNSLSSLSRRQIDSSHKRAFPRFIQSDGKNKGSETEHRWSSRHQLTVERHAISLPLRRVEGGR